MSEKLKNSTDRNSTWFLSTKIRKNIKAFSLSIWLLIWWNSLADGINIQNNHTKEELKQLDTKFNSELKYFFIQENFWLVKAIEEKSKDENKDFLKFVISGYEYKILYYSTEILKKQWTNKLVYTLSKERLDSLSIIKDSIVWLIDARYWKEQSRNFKDWIENLDSKLVFKFIKLENWNYIISDVYITWMEKEDSKWLKNTNNNSSLS